MKKSFSPRSLALSIIAISLLTIIIIITTTSSKASSPLGTRLSGKILLQVEDNGKAWYVSADNDNQRIYLGSPEEAHCLMKTLGLGISNNDLNRYLNTNTNKFPARLSGKILLAVEKNGEAYYINPDNLRGYYLGRPIDALKLMRELSLGITNANLNTIPVLDNTEMLKKCNIITKPEEQTETNISLVTSPVAPMTNFSHIVSISATITNPDNISIKERGLLYDFTIFPNTNLIPTLDKHNQKLISEISSNNNTYTVNISNLTPGSYPFIRSYAITSDNQIIYGNIINIVGIHTNHLPYLSSASSGGSLAISPSTPEEPANPVWETCGDIYYDDRDDNTYNTVEIGDQCWFQENLNIGDMLCEESMATSCATNSTEDEIIEKYCYENDSANCDTYGGLYQWEEMMNYTTSTTQGICPTGWHIPSDIEWTELSNFLGGDAVAGELLKASSTWDGTNSSGFTALPAGVREDVGGFYGLGGVAGFWSSSESLPGDSWYRYLKLGGSVVDRINFNQTFGFSFRCLKDAPKTITYVADVGGYINEVGTGTTTQEITYGGDGEEVIAIPADGYEFVQWSDGSTSTTRTDLNITDNITITAEFFESFVSCGDQILDTRDYNIYDTVAIGNQCWFQENLAYLPVVHSNAEFATQGSSLSPGYGVYGYNGSDVATAKLESNYSTYGVLYNWYAVSTTTNGNTNLCPDGWHLPTDAEFTTLSDFLGGESIAGGKMKQAGTVYWNSPNTGADNSSGFTALPAGSRKDDGDFGSLGGFAIFWSSPGNGPGDSWLRYLRSGFAKVFRNIVNQNFGYSVRCLRTD